jgi:serine/threonine-protein kinase
MFDNTTASSLELLRFRREFSERPGFEAALRQRVRQLDGFGHPSVNKVRAVEWLGSGEGLALISNQAPGRRLSDLLDGRRRVQGPAFALGLIRQLAPALAAFQAHGDDVSHGLLSPERIYVAPDGRLVLVEHVVGSAMTTLGLSADRLRRELGVAVPTGSALVPALDRRHDVVQLAFVALSLLLGRRLDPAEYPKNVRHLLDEYARTAPLGAGPPSRLRAWLERALQLDGQSYASATDANNALTDLLEGAADRSRVALPAPGQLAGAFQAISMNRSQLAVRQEPDDDLDPAMSPWGPPPQAEPPVPVPATQPEPVPVPVTAARPARRSKRVIVTLATLAVIQTGVIAGLVLWRSRSTPSSVAPPQVTAPLPTPDPPTDARAGGSPAGSLEVSPVNPAAPSGALAVTPPAAPPPGNLDITSDPPGARVTVDGERKGVTPLLLPLPAGQHTVVVSDGRTTSTRTLTVPSAGTASFVAALAPLGAAAGWVTINSPIELQVLEGGALLGTTSMSRLMLPAGKHQLDLASSALGFQTSIAVDVQPGKSVAQNVALPNGSLSINALPWANVFVDGKSVGTTPVANLEIPIGTHEVVWRHPQFGERRQTIVVTLKSPVRLQVDLSK